MLQNFSNEKAFIKVAHDQATPSTHESKTTYDCAKDTKGALPETRNRGSEPLALPSTAVVQDLRAVPCQLAEERRGAPPPEEVWPKTSRKSENARE